jgi:hypothetical protein
MYWLGILIIAGLYLAIIAVVVWLVIFCTARQNQNAVKKIALVLFIIGLYLFVTSDPSGYCPEQKRVLSDEEFIYIAMRGTFESGQMKLDALDTSVQVYYANHPKCCSVTKGDSSVFPSGIFSYAFAQASITYEMSAQEIIRMNPITETFYTQIVDITVCGKIMAWRGISERPPEAYKQKYTQ